MMRRPSGQVQLDSWQPPQPGDELIALPYLDPKFFNTSQEVITALFQVALAARVIKDWWRAAISNPAGQPNPQSLL